MPRAAARLCLAALGLGLAACSTRAPGADAGPAATTSAATASAASASLAPPPATSTVVTARGLADAYRGTIDPDIPVTVRLEQQDNRVTGSYFYETRGIDLALSGALDAEGRLALTETTAGKTTGSFSATLGPSGELDGTWDGAQGGRRPLHLEPIPRRAGAPAIILKKWHRSHRTPRVAPPAGSPILQCNLDLAYPEVFGLGDARVEAALNERLRSAQLHDHSSEGCEAPFATNAGYAVHANRDGVLSVSYTYDTACVQCAHPSFGGEVVNVLLDTGAPLPLDALLVPGGRAKVLPLIAGHVAARIKATPGATDEDAGWLRTAYLAGDYVIEDKGLRLIAFFRLQHAIQALDGDFGVLVPWATLGPLLDPKSPAARAWPQ